MAKCTNCGAENDDTAMTCVACNQPMKKDEGAGMGAGGEPAEGSSDM